MPAGWFDADVASMAYGIGSIVDGWGNRDLDVGAF
jgi:hypothetical protein